MVSSLPSSTCKKKRNIMVYINTNDINKIIRKQLKSHWPAVKFSVRKRHDSTVIEWTDGPTQNAVQELTAWASGATFDPMQDMSVPNDPVSAINNAPDMIVADELAKLSGSLDETVTVLNSFVHIKRHYSDDVKRETADLIEKRWNLTIARDDNGLATHEFDERCRAIGAGAQCWSEVVQRQLAGTCLV